jgi:phospholipid-binding lipoprotein MlaA
MILLSTLGACASQRQVSNGEQTDEDKVVNVDPWEGFNRSMFSFNMTLDKWVMKPVAKTYDFIVPDPVQGGVNNFFSNLGEIKNVVHDIFQWKWKQAGNDTGRFLINSTVGVAGIFDVAQHLGLKEGLGEDTGQTLGRWGMKRGPYLVMPFFGPTTLRDSPGLLVDGVLLNPLAYIENREVRWTLVGTNFVQTRVNLFDVEDLASGDQYLFLRDAYLQRRDYVEADGAVEEDYEDDFGDEDF